MRDKKTGLTDRTKYATERYIAENLIDNNKSYTFPQALREAGYATKYVTNWACKIWQNVGVQALISKVTSALQVKTQIKTDLTIESVLLGIQKAKKSCLDEAGEVKRGSLLAYLRCIELEGKYLAMWSDKHVVEAIAGPERLTQAEWQEDHEKAEAAQKQLEAMAVEAVIVR